MPDYQHELSLTCDLSALKKAAGRWEVESTQRYSAAGMERMMKLQDVLLKTIAKKIMAAGRKGDFLPRAK
jgi:hypothetical protein